MNVVGEQWQKIKPDEITFITLEQNNNMYRTTISVTAICDSRMTKEHQKQVTSRLQAAADLCWCVAVLRARRSRDCRRCCCCWCWSMRYARCRTPGCQTRSRSRSCSNQHSYMYIYMYIHARACEWTVAVSPAAALTRRRSWLLSLVSSTDSAYYCRCCYYQILAAVFCSFGPPLVATDVTSMTRRALWMRQVARHQRHLTAPSA